MAWIVNPAASSGAGYDDQNNNSDGYRQRKGVYSNGTEPPACGAFEHVLLIGSVTRKVYEMQEDVRIK